MSPLFWEDSLGAKLSERFTAITDRVRDAENARIDDLDALERAETDVRAGTATDQYDQMTADWMPAVSPSVISGILAAPGPNAMMLVSALDAEGVPYVWDPYPPESMPAFRPSGGAVDRPFRILVPADRLQEVRELLGGLRGSLEPIALSRRPADLPSLREMPLGRRALVWCAAMMFLGGDATAATVVAVVWVISEWASIDKNPRPPRIGAS